MKIWKPRFYTSKAAICKRSDDSYALVWNVNNSTLSELNEAEILKLIEELQDLVTLPPGKNGICRFPPMTHQARF